MSNSSADHSETAAAQPLPVQAGVCASSRRSVCHAALLGIVGLAAAWLSWAAMEQIGEVFQLSPEIARLGVGQIPGAEDQKKIVAGKLVLFYKHAALWLGTTGVFLGGLSGLALGRIRQSRTAIILATVGGIVLGGAFSAAAGALAVYSGQLFLANLANGPLTIPEHQVMLMHALTWLVVGLGVGLGTGLGTTWQHASGSMLISGIAGALGGALYPFVASVAMPLVDASFPVPEGDASRLLWLGLPCAIIGLAIGRRG